MEGVSSVHSGSEPRRDGDRDDFHEAASSVSSAEEGRFPAGTVLAGRYRVLRLIGFGGMGEVYRS